MTAISAYPELLNEWDYGKNSPLTPDDVTHGSNKKVWWKCSKGHSWQAVVKSRCGGRGCPYCSGSRIMAGFNDLATTHPELVLEWDYKKNTGLLPQMVSKGCNKKVYWIGDKCGHSWSATVVHRVNGQGCPYCAGKCVLAGLNDLSSKNPNLAKEWDYEKNDVTPDTIGAFSNKKVWWKCSKGHSWQAPVNNRSAGRGCPYCSNKKVLYGYNDLVSTNPKLAAEFDLVKNAPLMPKDIFSNTNKKLWWKCEQGHSWCVTPNNRISKGLTGCPYCSRRFAVSGQNDLTITHPDIANQFDQRKNLPLSPDNLLYGSNKQVWWKCDKGHSWQARVVARTKENNATGCPICWSKTFVSKAEEELLAYVQSLVPAVGTYKGLQNVFEVDVYVPNKKVAIEFNGLYWHSEAKKDCDYHYNKWFECKRQGVQLIQVWEDEWLEKSDVVKKMLAHKLGASTEPCVYARKTTAFEVEAHVASVFFEQNHIQGYGAGSIRVGLENNGDLVACGIFKKRSADTVELVRYATSCKVTGGQGKILKYIKTHYPEIQKIVTFADHCVSNGGLYEALGFTRVGELKPDYKYVVNNKRVHKFGYRLKKFKADPNLFFKEGMTERELAQTNGLLRIYDAGKTKYVLDITR